MTPLSQPIKSVPGGDQFEIATTPYTLLKTPIKDRTRTILLICSLFDDPKDVMEFCGMLGFTIRDLRRVQRLSRKRDVK